MIGRRQQSYTAPNPPTSVEYAVVGGGGGSSSYYGGGGGAGEVVTGTWSNVQATVMYNIQVGSGGSTYSQGYSSYIRRMSPYVYYAMAFGGGPGKQFGGYGNGNDYSRYNEFGCGGGGSAYNYNSASHGNAPGAQHILGNWQSGAWGGQVTYPPTHSNPYASWGRDGDASQSYDIGGGGGGASLAGSSTSSLAHNKNGVDGVDISAVTGSTTWVAGGGGGCGYYQYGAVGGNGGGGQGNPNYQNPTGGTSGAANSGGGGGGAYTYGGSGIVFLAYPNTYDNIRWIRYGGAVLNTSVRPGYKVYAFTSYNLIWF